MKKFVDISGFVYSGKSSISDILREIDGFIVPAVEEEFDLLRIPNGLIDLKNSVNDWSPIRTYAALNRFEKVARNVGTLWKFPYKYFRHGLNYEARYPQYFKLLNQFINEITFEKWITPWPYSHFEDNGLETFFRKISEKLGYIKLREYKLIYKNTFLTSAQKYTSDLLWSNYPDRTEHTLVTHNALEPFNPHQNSDLLSNCKCIVVDRDPRDIYATAQIIPPGQADKLNRYRNMCAGHDVHKFIQRYKLYRSLVVENPNVLRLQFSEIVLNYEQTLKLIYSFLDIDPKLHIRKGDSFKPEISIQSNGLYKSDKVKTFQNDFLIIEKELGL
jgi:hypothetical protein